MTNGNAMPSPSVELVGLSDVGRRRNDNQDAYGLLVEQGVALLADGMGGHARGELASALAISSALRALIDSAPPRGRPAGEDAERLADAVAVANRAVHATAAETPDAVGMGTTLTALLFAAGQLHVAHVGDSRLYRLRDDGIERLTTDQTVGELLAARGTRRGAPMFANVLTQAIGCEAEVTPEVRTLEWIRNDLYLLCSDGLHGMLDDDEIRLTLLKFGDNLVTATRELVRLANEHGGHDNITVVLARP